VVERYIEHYAKPKQRTWHQTQRVLKQAAADADWWQRPIDAISKNDVRELLRGYDAAGHPYKATNTEAWLRSLWHWAYTEDLVTAPIMDGVKIEYNNKHPRERFYTDDEIRSIWHAAEQLEPIAMAYYKLLILLAPRKTALALMEWQHLDKPLTLWTTPFELTKSRKSSSKQRTYLTPLPALATQILKELPREREQGRVFPTLPTMQQRNGLLTLQDQHLNAKLKKHGAPADFYPHAIRHTIATYLQNKDHSEWECGLVLNHSGQGVTAGYSHGFPRKLKLELLEEWATHVKGLVQPTGPSLIEQIVAPPPERKVVQLRRGH
jgi:integrase